MAHAWFPGSDLEQLRVTRLSRGTLQGSLPDLVAFCLGSRQSRARQLDWQRIGMLWDAQRPGLVGSDAFGVIVRERAFRKWARRNVSRFGLTKRRLQQELLSEEWWAGQEATLAIYLPPDSETQAADFARLSHEPTS